MSHPKMCEVIGKGRVLPTLPSVATRLGDLYAQEPMLTATQAEAEARRCTAASPCLFCEVCELICPDLAITRQPSTRAIQVDLDYCKGCGLCAHYCPHGAIAMVIDD